MFPRFKTRLCTLIFLVILQGTAVVLFYRWYVQNQPVNDPPPKPKVHVLLVSSWRSGSSFMGQIFNRHPSVFFLYEPAWNVWFSLIRQSARALRMAVRDQLRSLFHCDFSVMDSYMPGNPKVSSLFGWSASRALCSPPVCPVTLLNPLDETECLKKCNVQDLQVVEEACDMHSHVVFKTVRIFELKSLYPLLQDPNLDLRIIHLVRDPRAVLRSREASAASFNIDAAIVLNQREVPKLELQYQVMQEICRGNVHINEVATKNPPPFLKGRYKLIRFEDVARNAVEEINGIFDFIGLEMTAPLKEWLYNTTHGKGMGKSHFEISSRNSVLVSEAWRTALPYSKVKRIQEVCKEVMSLMGYKTVNSETEQKKTDIDLLAPREQNHSSRVSASKQNKSNKLSFNWDYTLG